MLPSWLSGKELTCQFRRCKFDPWVRKVPWRRKWQPTPVFLPGKSHGQRSKRCNQATKQQQTSTDSSNITMQTQYLPHLTSHKAAFLIFHIYYIAWPLCPPQGSKQSPLTSNSGSLSLPHSPKPAAKAHWLSTLSFPSGPLCPLSLCYSKALKFSFPFCWAAWHVSLSWTPSPVPPQCLPGFTPP